MKMDTTTKLKKLLDEAYLISKKYNLYDFRKQIALNNADPQYESFDVYYVQNQDKLGVDLGNWMYEVIKELERVDQSGPAFEDAVNRLDKTKETETFALKLHKGIEYLDKLISSIDKTYNVGRLHFQDTVIGVELNGKFFKIHKLNDSSNPYLVFKTLLDNKRLTLTEAKKIPGIEAEKLDKLSEMVRSAGFTMKLKSLFFETIEFKKLVLRENPTFSEFELNEALSRNK